MRTLLLVLGAVVLLALGWAQKAWGQTGVVPPFSIAPLPIPAVTTTTVNANASTVGLGPVLFLPEGTDPELVVRAIQALRGTPAILPDSAIVPGTPMNPTPSPTGGAIDEPVVVTPAPVIVPTPKPRVLKDPPMVNPGGNPKTISLF